MLKMLKMSRNTYPAVTTLVTIPVIETEKLLAYW